jgi:hypothetical protein
MQEWLPDPDVGGQLALRHRQASAGFPQRVSDLAHINKIGDQKKPMTEDKRPLGRILARADNPAGKAPEIDWIESEVRLLGKSFGRARRDIEADIDAGIMIVVSDT